MSAKARRRLTLETEHERAIHLLCEMANAAVWALRNCDLKQREIVASELEEAYKYVADEVMP